MDIGAALWNGQREKQIVLVAVRRIEVDGLPEPHHGPGHFLLAVYPAVGDGHPVAKACGEIGRASCRERVWSSVGAGWVQEKGGQGRGDGGREHTESARRRVSRTHVC